MRQSENHRVLDLLRWDMHVLMTQHCAIKCAVVDHDHVSRVDHHLDAVQRAALGQVHDLDLFVVKRIRHEQHLGILCVLVRAMCDWRLAIGF